MFVYKPPPYTYEHQPAEHIQSDKSQLSDSQDLAAAVLMHQQINREKKVQKAQKQAKEQAKPANDNQPAQKYCNPVTGQEMTPEAYQKLQDFIKRQNERDQERKARGRGGLEY